MGVRSLAAAGGLALAVVVAGCATSVAGQAEMAVTPAVAGTSVPGFPTSNDSGGPLTTSLRTLSAPTTLVFSTSLTISGPLPQPPLGRSSGSVPDGPTSIPGLSADCKKVVAAISAFTTVLQDSSATTGGDVISQATVDAALKQLPAAGLPAAPQADINILRETVRAAVGKTVTQLGMTMADGKVLGALQDLSSWAATNCT